MSTEAPESISMDDARFMADLMESSMRATQSVVERVQENLERQRDELAAMVVKMFDDIERLTEHNTSRALEKRLDYWAGRVQIVNDGIERRASQA